MTLYVSYIVNIIIIDFFFLAHVRQGQLKSGIKELNVIWDNGN